MFTKSLIGLFVLEDIRAIDAYIFCDSLLYVLFPSVLSIFLDLYAQILGFSVFQWDFISKVSGFGKFAIKLSSDPHLKHVSGFRPLRSLHLLLELRELKEVAIISKLGMKLHSECTLIEKTFLSRYLLLNCPNSNNWFGSQIWIIFFINNFSSLLKYAWRLDIWTDYFYLDWNFQESVNQLIFSINIYHQNFQSLIILKSLDTIDHWLPSFF